MLAQAPELGGLLPAGGPRGSATQVRIAGKNLAGARVHLSGAGVTVQSVRVSTSGDELLADIAVDPTARLGPREVRISTPKGVSGGARFWVDLYPNRILSLPLAETAPPIPLERTDPIVINSRIAAKAGRDRFVLTAEANETWVFDCFADRIRSRFDPVLEIRDEAGKGVKLVQSMWESDPRFSFTFKKAGKYFLTVRDAEFLGGPNFTYRLLVGRMPYVTAYSPRGERPGHTVQLAVEGPHIPRTISQVEIPKDAAPGPYWAEVAPAGGSPMPVSLIIDPDPVFCAVDTEAASPLPALPAAIDGIFTRCTRNRFSFHATPAQKVEFDLLGRRIGSRIDGELRVLDAAGKEVAANDDTVGKDAHLTFSAPAEGAYTLEVRNVEEITGPDCFYRLKAKLVQPDFKVAIATDRLSVSKGGTTSLPVTAERTGGFEGPIEVRVEGLPSGVECSGGLIPAGKNSVEITLTSAEGAAVEAKDIHIVGEAGLAGKTAKREALALERYEHRSIDLLLSVEYSYTRPNHVWDMLLLGITEPAPTYSLSTIQKVLTLAPGGKAEIEVHAVRRGPDGEIKLELRNLPPKVTAAVVPIPAKQNDVKIVLTAAPDAPADISNLIVQGRLGDAVQIAPAVRITVAK